MIVCDLTWCDSNVFLPLVSCGFSEQRKRMVESKQVKNLYIAQIKNLALVEVIQRYLKNGKLKLFVTHSISSILMNSNIFNYWEVNLSLNISWNVLITVYNTSSHWNRWLSEKIGQFCPPLISLSTTHNCHRMVWFEHSITHICLVCIIFQLEFTYERNLQILEN